MPPLMTAQIFLFIIGINQLKLDQLDCQKDYESFMLNFNTQEYNKPKNLHLFVITILLIYPLPQMAIDLYLPSWPAMISSLNSTQSILQLTLTSYILFLGIAQLIYGPLADRFGRRVFLLVGIFIFILSSLACAFTHSSKMLIFFRICQGLGIGCGFTIASAILADIFEGDQLARITSYSAMIYSLSLILAPVVGSYIQTFIGWQGNFLIMAIYGLLLLIMVYFLVWETCPPQQRSEKINLLKIFSYYKKLLTKASFVTAIITLITAYGLMITFNTLGPFLLQTQYGVSVIHYGHLVLLTGLAYFLGSTFNSQMVNKFGRKTLIKFGILLIMVSSTILLGLNIFALHNLIWTMLLIIVVILSAGFVFPNCYSLALDCSHEHKAYAGALVGSSILLGVSAISYIVSYFKTNYELYLALSFLVLGSLSWLSFIINIRRENE